MSAVLRKSGIYEEEWNLFLDEFHKTEDKEYFCKPCWRKTKSVQDEQFQKPVWIDVLKMFVSPTKVSWLFCYLFNYVQTISEVFVIKDEPYNLRSSNNLVLPRARSSLYGFDTKP